MLVEKNIAPNVKNHYHIKAQFTRLGWDGCFNLPNYYYREVVQEFYANVEDKTKFHLVHLIRFKVGLDARQ